MRKDEPELLEMLVRHESVVKELYEIFSTMFKDSQSLWKSLAADEQKHVEWLETLRSESTIGGLLQGSQLKPQAITMSIRYVESQLARAREGKLSLLQAFSIARDLENAAVERVFSKLAGSAPEKIRSVLIDLSAETEKHRRTIIEALEQHGGGDRT